MSKDHMDRFIGAMHKMGAEELRFDVGSPVRTIVQGRERVILEQAVRGDQIDKLVRPLIDPGEVPRYLEQGHNEFAYDAPSGRVQLSVRRSGDQLSAVVSPDRGVHHHAGLEDPLREFLGAGRSADPVPAAPAPAPVIHHPPTPVPYNPPPETAHAPSDFAPAPNRSWAPDPIALREVNKILTQLVHGGGSDLHLTANHKPMMRKDGEMADLPGWGTLSSEQLEKWLMGVAHLDARKQFEDTNDSDFAYEIEGLSRFRMNVFRDRHGVGGVMRTIPSEVLSAEQLGLPPVVMGFCQLTKGLVTVTGPTGSGKSTTLAAMIDWINKNRKEHIITIEDPVEFVHRSQKCLVNQREVHRHTKSFSSALRAALREDPDVVLVGEMRDLETVAIAIETAETGHLVFGTLHTNTAASTVDRIIDQFPTDRQAQIRVMLSESLKGVVSQTLCKKKGGGRVACLEILVVNNAVSNLIREGKTFQIPSIMQSGRGQGMQTQSDAMLALVKSGRVEPLEALRKAVNQQEMRGVLERAGHPLPA